MRVLITGARGQLGQSLRERVPEEWEVIFTDSKTLDITNPNSVNALIQGFQPEVVINTAAYTNVDGAQESEAAAFAVNADGVRHLARAVQDIAATLIHISSDYVFDGKKITPYTTGDNVNPQTEYGKSKLAGELAALASCDKAVIVRTSNLYSEYGDNFVKKIVRNYQENGHIVIHNNPISCPTYAGNLANQLIALIEQIEQNQILPKLLHYTDGTALSRADFAALILQHVLKLDNAAEYIKLDLQTTNKRPVFSAMEVSEGFSAAYHPTGLEKILAALTEQFSHSA